MSLDDSGANGRGDDEEDEDEEVDEDTEDESEEQVSQKIAERGGFVVESRALRMARHPRKSTRARARFE